MIGIYIYWFAVVRPWSEWSPMNQELDMSNFIFKNNPRFHVKSEFCWIMTIKLFLNIYEVDPIALLPSLITLAANNFWFWKIISILKKKIFEISRKTNFEGMCVGMKWVVNTWCNNCTLYWVLNYLFNRSVNQLGACAGEYL